MVMLSQKLRIGCESDRAKEKQWFHFVEYWTYEYEFELWMLKDEKYEQNGNFNHFNHIY